VNWKNSRSIEISQTVKAKTKTERKREIEV
jgi:hypothetical protein